MVDFSKEGSFSYKWGEGFNTIYMLFYFLLVNRYNKQYKYLYIIGEKYLIPKSFQKSPPFWPQYHRLAKSNKTLTFIVLTYK